MGRKKKEGKRGGKSRGEGPGLKRPSTTTTAAWGRRTAEAAATHSGGDGGVEGNEERNGERGEKEKKRRARHARCCWRCAVVFARATRAQEHKT